MQLSQRDNISAFYAFKTKEMFGYYKFIILPNVKSFENQGFNLASSNLELSQQYWGTIYNI